MADVNVKEAWDLACYKREHSNVARAFIEAVDLLRGAQTHLLDGDNSAWRQRLDKFLDGCGCESERVIHISAQRIDHLHGVSHTIGEQCPICDALSASASQK